MSNKKQKTFKHPFLLFTGVIFAGITIILPFFIHSIVDSKYVKQEVSQFVYEKTGTKIDLKKINFKVFPRPYLKINRIKIELAQDYKKKGGQKKQGHTANLIIGSALFYPNFKTLIHAKGKTISGTLEIKKIHVYNLTNTGISITKNIKTCSIDYLKIIFTHNHQKDFHAVITGEHPQLFLKNTKLNTLSGNKFKAYIDIEDGKTQIALDMLKLDFPSMFIAINFLNNKSEKQSLLEISGKNIDINETRQVAITLLKGNKISNEIFKIIRSGKTDAITISFHGNDLKTLFHVKNMVIKGTIDNGSIGIPETGLVTTQTAGSALVKKGILYTDIQKGRIGNSSFKKARLSVNILSDGHPFKGLFPIDANLNDLANILKKLLPKTLLEHELNLCTKIKGSARGELILDKKDKKKLFISVHASNIILEARYQRIPGKIFIKGGNFTYEDEKSISVDKLSGYIGVNKFSDLYASIGLKNDHFLEIKSGKAFFILKDIFPWLVSFKKINSALLPLKSATGTININSINLKGPVLSPGQWKYKVEGSCHDINLGTSLLNPESALSSNNKITSANDISHASETTYGNEISYDNKTAYADEISSASLDFKILSKKIFLSNLNADIKRPDLLLSEFSRLSQKHEHITDIKRVETQPSSFTETSLLNDIAFPLSISGAQFLSTKKAIIFKGKISFKTGPELFITMRIPKFSKIGTAQISTQKIPAEKIIQKKSQKNTEKDNHQNNKKIKSLSDFSIFLKIKDKNISNATISYTKNKSSASLDMKGVLQTASIEKILKKESRSAEKLFFLTKGKNFTIKSNKNSGIVISTDFLDLNNIIKKQKEKMPDTKNIYFPEFPHNFSFKANTMVLKKRKFTPFEAKVSIDNNKSIWTILMENTKFCDINITGIINKNNKNNNISISMDFHKKKGDLSRSISCIFDETGLVKGDYSILGELKSTGTMDHLFDNLNGKITFHSPGGRIYKLTLLSRILSVINISKFIKGRLPNIVQNGFAYNFIDIKADIKGSVLLIKSAVIKGVDMTLTFNGRIDLVQGTSEVTCLVSPFKTADMVIKHIPLLGHILNGQLVSIPVKITGKLNDPKVALLPASAVGKGLIDIMERTLETPFRIMRLIQ